METMTIRQAFDAMVCFLDGYYQRGKSDDIGALLGQLSLHIWADDMTGDPALWDDWMQCVQKLLFPETSEHRQMLEELISDQANYLGTDEWGSEWYAQLLPDGGQLWALVSNNEIQYGGMRKIPKAFDPKHGLSHPSDP